jgi:CHAD domain-containing protein
MHAGFQGRLSIADLCAKYENEDAHANKVAALALALFDATHEVVGAPAGDRPLLEAACRLHDLGYGANPRRHAGMSREIILQEGLKGFTNGQRAEIAAAVLLHPAGHKRNEAQSHVRQPADARRALRLAAYLRIADGLDHGHLQDAVIVGVGKIGRTIRVRVRCAHCPENIEVARRKSDLWRVVFPLGIRLAPATGMSVQPSPLLSHALPPGEAARRLLLLNYRGLLVNVDGALEAKDGEALHDLRVAIRRMRAVVRAFRRPLAPTSAARIDRDLQKLNFALGDARDLDVWIDYLEGRALKARLRRHPRWAKFVDHQRELRRLRQTTLQRHLRGPSFAALRYRIGRLLRIELPHAAGVDAPGSLEAFGRRVLVKHLRRAGKLGHLRHSHSPVELHELRIALRRVRHIGGFFRDVLGPPTGELMKRVHAVEWALGRIRDVDLAFARIQRDGPAPPRLLVEKLERRRQIAVAELADAWRRFEKPRFLRTLRRQSQG